MASNITGWLAEYRHPLESAPFALPSAIYFLIKFRADLAQFESRTVRGRMELYFWWKALGRKDYPDFDWELREQDVTFLRQFDGKTLIEQFPESVALWLRSSEPDVLEPEPLILALSERRPIAGSGMEEFPRFLDLIINSRPDLFRTLDLSTFAGQLAAMNWWESHGRDEYPRLNWTSTSIWRHLNEPAGVPTALGMPAPRFLPLLLAERPDLKPALTMNTLLGMFACVEWWERHGKQEYPRLSWSTAGIWTGMNEIDSIDSQTGLRLPRFLKALLAERTDLPISMTTNSLRGLFECANWWERHGRLEYSKLAWSTGPLWNYLSRVVEDTTAVLRLPRFLSVLIDLRADLRNTMHTDTASGQLACYEWWNSHGRNEYPMLEWSNAGQWEQLLEPYQADDIPTPLPKFLYAMWRERMDLQAAFDLRGKEGVSGLVHWWQSTGRGEYNALAGADIQFDNQRGQYVAMATQRLGAFPLGVNIIGFPQGSLGLGEDARTAARVFERLQIPVVLVNAPMVGPAKRDHSADHLLSADLRYGVTLFCLPPPEMVRLALEGGRRIIDSNTYKIGAWPWELPHWPQAFGQVHGFVDEIWAQSRFVEAVYKRLGHSRVVHMPMAVEIPKPVNPNRRRFEMAEDRFLFYLMFDGNSWLSRKNPIAGVQAFQKAFGSDSEPVGLVIKAMNVRDSDPTWQDVLRMAEADPRIQIVSEHMSRQDSVDFMATCDAYISLHRSEGFGRVIAEAMGLGQPVVATNFSGNVDFCDQQTSYLVDGELVPLHAGEYLFSEGQYWCDPDVSVAAQQLRRLYENPKERARIAAAGQARIKDSYSLAAVARAYETRLKAIVAEGGVLGEQQ
ncbi:glycosyltransferase [Cupriavidus sp. WKF15]|uniref:glycosyltransferase family 4 protein n=1 Tax=Cupriavidus sp. WKF15 TaxID=3032282 RepID=UPI0023E1C312|nr:glycosyltransferase [Cupriavidus sp. WKF15]WER45185.1 glycosyltransferase [Cupriavidus sp. WKF15]